MLPGNSHTDDATLLERLEGALGEAPLEIVSREQRGSGTFPKELVSCRTPAGEVAHFFCKYAAPRDPAHGHRGGVWYESRVYRELLSRSGLRTPRMIGSAEDGSWLILEALTAGDRLKHVWASVPAAAAWLGRFHLESANRTSDAALDFLVRYDQAYYAGWAERSCRHAAESGVAADWWPALAERFASIVPDLLRPEALTVIHGEFTVKNVMVVSGEVCPTDWESAAVAAGEIDLMCLIEGCSEDVTRACRSAYEQARWPAGAPAGHLERQLAAELYLHFRWLGETLDGFERAEVAWRRARLRSLARELVISR